MFDSFYNLRIMKFKYYPFLSYYVKKTAEHFSWLENDMDERVIKCENFDIMDHFDDIEAFACEMGMEEAIVGKLEGQYEGEYLFEAVEHVYEMFFYTIDCVVFEPLQEEYANRKLMEIMGLKMVLEEKGIVFGPDGEELEYFSEFLL